MMMHNSDQLTVDLPPSASFAVGCGVLTSVANNTFKSAIEKKVGNRGRFGVACVILGPKFAVVVSCQRNVLSVDPHSGYAVRCCALLWPEPRTWQEAAQLHNPARQVLEVHTYQRFDQLTTLLLTTIIIHQPSLFPPSAGLCRST